LETVSISAETVGLLVSITKDFISESIRRIIISKELEARLKREMKVWKYDRGEVSAENVTECLVSMGLGQLNKENFFETILGQGHEEREDVAILSARSSPAGLIDDATVPNFWTNGDSLEQGIFLPHSFTPPHPLQWCSLPSHHDLFSSDDICDLDCGDGDLDLVMQEEEQLDKEDTSISEEYESLLWNQSHI